MLAGLVVLVVLACAANTYQRVATPAHNQPQKVQTTSAALANTGLSIPNILAMQLFGSASNQSQTESNPQDIPKTNLKLVLKGAFSHSDAKQASALIATDKGKRAELYAIDSVLPGNATLKEVHPSYVVLSRAGRLEKLLFYRSQGLIDPDRNKTPPSQSDYDYVVPKAYVQDQQAAPKNKKESSRSLSPIDIRALILKQAEKK